MNQQTPKAIRVNCGEICLSTKCSANEINLLHRNTEELERNITIGYERFIENSSKLPPRILDLLQIAAYIFCGDRMSNRGQRNSLGNDAWARSFEFQIPVMDIDFWNKKQTKQALNDVLTFMTGDRHFDFVFIATNKNPAEKDNEQLSLFSDIYCEWDDADQTDIMLFSGGLDSLAGVIQHLNEHPDRLLCAVSHKSNKSVTHTQSALLHDINIRYNNRVKQYGFECCNHNGLKSRDETQRTRMFLFSAIAFSLCNRYGKHSFYVYENGITSMNLPKQTDVINARASRTTHPKTLGLLRKFYKLIDPSFEIIAPYYNMTKSEIVKVFEQYNEKKLIASSVSCSSSRTKPGQVPHCGCCSQCIDRKFSLYAAGLDEYDAEYARDFITEFPDDDNNETKQRIYTTMRLASREDISTKEDFLKKYSSEILDLMEYWPGLDNAEDKLDEIYSLICRYGDSVIKAATAMRNKFDDLTRPIIKNSLLGIISERGYMQTPCFNRVVEIDRILKKAIPNIFQREKPANENDFNDKIHAILNVHDEFTREYPVLLFGLTSYRADQGQGNLIVESKYIRGKTSPSTASEGIAADITKISDGYGILFVVYDPEGKIVDAEKFSRTFEKKRKDCYVRVYR